jgi:hypothetical protein
MIRKVRHEFTGGFRGALAALITFFVGIGTTFAEIDVLPSWNDGAAKTAIVDFVGRITTAGGTDFVAPEQRIATFDNDGTLWAEQPVYFQLAYAIDQIKALGPSISIGRKPSPTRLP